MATPSDKSLFVDRCGDALADLGAVPHLSLAEPVEDELAHLADVAGSARLEATVGTVAGKC
jgi:hypothetical protein